MSETNKTYLVKVCESQYKLKLSTYMQRIKMLSWRLKDVNQSLAIDVIPDDEKPTFSDADGIKYEIGVYEG